jgi:hypothetical protein
MNKQTFDIVNEILVKYDLMGLISEGAPLDEYTSEAKSICDLIIDEGYSVRLIKDYLERTFDSEFSDVKSYDQVAQELFDLLRS